MRSWTSREDFCLAYDVSLVTSFKLCQVFCLHTVKTAINWRIKKSVHVQPNDNARETVGVFVYQERVWQCSSLGVLYSVLQRVLGRALVPHRR